MRSAGRRALSHRASLARPSPRGLRPATASGKLTKTTAACAPGANDEGRAVACRGHHGETESSAENERRPGIAPSPLFRLVTRRRRTSRRLVILDNPTVGGDATARDGLYRILRELAVEGVGESPDLRRDVLGARSRPSRRVLADGRLAGFRPTRRAERPRCGGRVPPPWRQSKARLGRLIDLTLGIDTSSEQQPQCRPKSRAVSSIKVQKSRREITLRPSGRARAIPPWPPG